MGDINPPLVLIVSCPILSYDGFGKEKKGNSLPTKLSNAVVVVANDTLLCVCIGFSLVSSVPFRLVSGLVGSGPGSTILVGISVYPVDCGVCGFGMGDFIVYRA